MMKVRGKDDGSGKYGAAKGGGSAFAERAGCCAGPSGAEAGPSWRARGKGGEGRCFAGGGTLGGQKGGGAFPTPWAEKGGKTAANGAGNPLVTPIIAELRGGFLPQNASFCVKFL